MIKECINITASQDGSYKDALYAVSSAEYPHFIKSEFGQFVLDGDGKSDKLINFCNNFLRNLMVI